MKKMEKITKLNIFDFDGTLVRSPLPETGKPEYERKTGVKWKHVGWWSKPESLDMDVFEIPVIKSTYDSCIKEKNLENVYTVMVTGRMFKLGPEVEKILKSNLLEFDEYHYNRGGDTFSAKIKTFGELIKNLPNVRTIEIWEDRLPHIEGFKKWGEEVIKDGFVDNVIVNLVE